MFNHVDHFGRQVPPFTRLITHLGNAGGTLRHAVDSAMGFKFPIRRFEGAAHWILTTFHRPQGQLLQPAHTARYPQVVSVPRC